eukprot:Selendium_serpulae@DN2919_c0_g1_i2.p1
MELFGHHMCPDFPPLPSNERGSSCKDGIIIIGAGIAGLSAAASLQLMGFTNVTVLEASGSVGGRLKSTPFVEKDGGPPLDIGAEWIHSVKGGEVLQSIMNFQNDDDFPKHNDTVVPDLIEYKPTLFVNKRKSRLLTWLY